MDLITNYPYWLLNQGIIRTYPSLSTDIKTEVVIPGGGISGALTAWHLGKAGVRVTLIDKRHIGMGSTASFQYASTIKDSAKLKEDYLARKRAGIKLQWLDKDDVKQKFGFQKNAGLLSKEGAEINAGKLVIACGYESTAIWVCHRRWLISEWIHPPAKQTGKAVHNGAACNKPVLRESSTT